MDNLVHIGNVDISIKEYKGKRVVAFKDIDMVHERPDGTARHRFAENKKHFVEGEDYFVLKPSDLENTELDGFRPVGIDTVSPRGTALITEQGYLMLVKSFTDDLAWEVQRKLVSSYLMYIKVSTINYLQNCKRCKDFLIRWFKKNLLKGKRQADCQSTGHSAESH